MAGMGFRLAAKKKEGYSSSFMNPAIESWIGCGKEFELYCKMNFSKWYYRPIRKWLVRLSRKAWDMALLEQANKGKR